MVHCIVLLFELTLKFAQLFAKGESEILVIMLWYIKPDEGETWALDTIYAS